MKKLLSVCLVLIILISCCACGADSNDVRGEIIPGGQNAAQPTVAPETTEAIPETTEAAPETTAPQFSFGQTSGNTYVNEFLGLSCTLPAEWIFYTDEEILALNNLVGENLDADVAELVQNANIIYDMYASIPNTGCSININLEKISAMQMLTLDIQQVLQSQISMIESTYSNMGYTNTTARYEKVTVDGKEYDGLYVSATINGVNFYSVTFSFVKGTYMANVGVSSLAEDTTGEILSYLEIA